MRTFKSPAEVAWCGGITNQKQKRIAECWECAVYVADLRSPRHLSHPSRTTRRFEVCNINSTLSTTGPAIVCISGELSHVPRALTEVIEPEQVRKTNWISIFKVAKGIVEPKLQKRWPQLCRNLRRSLFSTNFVEFSWICVVIKCFDFRWMTQHETFQILHGKNDNFEPVFEPVLGRWIMNVRNEHFHIMFRPRPFFNASGEIET